jgi:hypothetical protein
MFGPITLTRAWYHCAGYGHGMASRDAGLGVEGASISPGLAAMNDRVAAAGPFAKAARAGRVVLEVAQDHARANRGSRLRCVPLRAPGIDPNLSSPLAMLSGLLAGKPSA